MLGGRLSAIVIRYRRQVFGYSVASASVRLVRLLAIAQLGWSTGQKNAPHKQGMSRNPF
jgi:hypothetical protein